MKHYNIAGKILKFLVYFLIVATTLFLIVPIVFTILGSFSAYWGKTMFSRGLTLQWYEYVFYYYGHTIGLTLEITCATVLINVLLGIEHVSGLFVGRTAWQLEGYLELLRIAQGHARGRAASGQDGG